MNELITADDFIGESKVVFREHLPTRVSLDQILGSNDVVLADACLRFEKDDGVAKEIYDPRYFDQVDLEVVERGIEYLETYQDFLETPNVYTVRGVSEEYNELIRIIGDSKDFFNKNDELFLASCARSRRKNVHGGSKKVDRVKQKIQDLYSHSSNLYRASQKREIRKKLGFDKQRHRLLTEMIRKISLISGIKETDSSDTDEQIIAAGFYLSAFSDEDIAILTRDSHLEKIARKSDCILGSGYFKPLSIFFRSRLLFNPPKIYFEQEDGSYRLVFNGEYVLHQKGFRFHSIPKKESDGFRDELKRDFQKLAS